MDWTLRDRQDAVIQAARRLVRLQARRCLAQRYVMPFLALVDLAVAVNDLEEIEPDERPRHEA